MKTLKQVKDRILQLQSRTKDWLDVTVEINVLEEIEPLVEDLNPEELSDVLKEIGAQYLYEEEYKKSRICIWALE